MKSLFVQMREHHELAQAAGQEIKEWTIRTDMFEGVEREAAEAGVLSPENRTIFGAPFTTADRVQTDNGILSIVSGSADRPSL